MTVSELIEELQKQPQDAMVLVRSPDDYENYDPVEKVMLQSSSGRFFMAGVYLNRR